MGEQPLFSIIVPVYNIEKYIVECLESIVNQTFDDYEVLLIDDGSTDNSGKICDEYAEKYDNVTAYHKENGGSSDARNYGIRIAEGKYVTFIDSDDFVDLDFLLQMSNLSTYDMVFWPYIREFDNSSVSKKLFDSDMEFSSRDCEKLRLSLFGPLGSENKRPDSLDKLSTSCCKFYRLDIIKNEQLKFEDASVIGTFEDGLFNINYIRFIKSAFYKNTCFYHYRKTNESSLTSVCRLDLFDKWDNLYFEISKIIEIENLPSEYSVALNNRIAISVYMLGSIAANSDKTFREKTMLLKSVLKKDLYLNAINEFDIAGMSVFWKIYYFFVKRKKTKTVLSINILIKDLLKLLR